MRPRELIRSVQIALLALLAAPVILLGGADPDSATPVLKRFLALDSPRALDNPRATAYRALRHLDGGNERMNKAAWMDVWTEADHAGGFTYTVVAEGGSEYIRSKVFLASLEKEREMSAVGRFRPRGAHARQLRLRRRGGGAWRAPRTSGDTAPEGRPPVRRVNLPQP